MINLKEILTGDPIRLRNIKRFSICLRVHEESVAEHSFYVAFISLIIASDLALQGFKIDLGKLLSRAIIHDLDEVFSGDFIRMFKHNNEEIKTAIEKTSNNLMTAFAENYTSGDEILKYWKESKAEDIEGIILSYADYLSVLSYLYMEINAGNNSMFVQLEELQKFHNTFYPDDKNQRSKFLEKYWVQAQTLLNELHEKWRLNK